MKHSFTVCYQLEITGRIVYSKIPLTLVTSEVAATKLATYLKRTSSPIYTLGLCTELIDRLNAVKVD